MDGIADEFWQERPEELKPVYRQLLNTFWSLKREYGLEKTIKSRDIIEEIDSLQVEQDIGLMIIQKIDDHHRGLYIDEMRRKNKK
jgi:hypothetical protein